MRVRKVWSGFKRFWLAEEVPRWLGLSLVLLYTTGLTAVAWTAISQARVAGRQAVEERTAHSVRLLGDQLAGTDTDDLRAQQLFLHQFARGFGCPQLRVIDRNRQVLASIQSDEIGGPDPFNPRIGTLLPRRTEVLRLPDHSPSGDAQTLFRAPIAGTGQVPQRFIEGVFAFSYPGSNPLRDHAGTLLVILVVTGALFLLYRRMRDHFRDVSAIAGNLRCG